MTNQEIAAIDIDGPIKEHIYFTAPINDGTAGHSKGNWYPGCLGTVENTESPGSIATVGNPKIKTLTAEEMANLQLLALAQSAPHDCGDPECPGFQNKRKLELYDKFQRAIHEFANAGLLT